MKRISYEALDSMKSFLRLDVHHTVEAFKVPEAGLGKVRRHFEQVVNIYCAESLLSPEELELKRTAEDTISAIDRHLKTLGEIKASVAALPVKISLRDPAHDQAREDERQQRIWDQLSRRVTVTTPDLGRKHHQQSWGKVL